MEQGRGPTPERLRAIALNRLKALGVQAWVSQGWARGRLVVRPEQFAPVSFAEVTIAQDQPFLVYQHAFLGFISPSPLVHLGGIRFYEERDQETLTASVMQRWAALVSGTEAALSRARAFRPDARLDVPSWNIETAVVEGGRRVLFRFDGRVAALYVYAVGDQVVEYADGEAPLAIALPTGVTHVDDTTLMPLVRAARARFGPSPRETGPIELELQSVDVASVDLDRGSQAPAESFSGDLSLDLDGLKTGDLLVEQPAALEPEVVTLVPEEDDQKLRRRHPREPQNVPAKLRWDAGTIDVVVADVSAGGVFVRTSASDLPAPGSLVYLSGFSPLAVTARVAHVRPKSEADLFSTGAGLGLAFERAQAQPGVRPHQDGLWCAALVTDAARRERALLALDAAHCVPVMVDHLLGLAVAMLHFDLAAILVETAEAERAVPALGLEEGPLLVVGDRVDAGVIRAVLAKKG